MSTRLNKISPLVRNGGALVKSGGGFTKETFGPAELFTMDWTPSLGNDLDDPNYPATYVWELEESSGATTLVESRVGGGTHDLAEQGGGGVWVGQTAPGITNGADLSSRKCIEGDEGAVDADRFESSGSSLECDAGSIAVRARLRRTALPNTSGNQVMGTRISGTGGWWIAWTNTGLLEFGVEDGTTLATRSSSSVEDGAWHEIEMIIDWTLDEMRVRVDGVALTDLDISSVVQANTTGGAFSLMGVPTGPSNRGARGVQIERVLGWEASDGAENIDATAWTDVSKLGAAPAGINSTYDTLPSYSGAASVPCDAGNDGLWYLASGDKATDDYPIGYSSLLEARGAANGFGRVTHQAWTNLVTRSEQLETTWTTSNATVSATAANLIDNKLGFRMARKVTASANSGYIAFPVTLSTSTQYHVYAYIAGNGGTVAGRIELYDTVGADAQGSQTFSVSDGVLSLVGKRIQSDATNTAHEVRIYIDTNTEAVNVCHVACCAEVASDTTFASAGVPIPTFGATATLPTLSGLSSAVGADDWLEAKGSLELSLVGLSGGSTGGYWCVTQVDNNTAAGQRVDRIHFRAEPSGTLHVRHWDGSGSVLQTISKTFDASLGVRCLYEWNNASPVSGTNHIRLRTTNSGGSTDDSAQTSAWSLDSTGVLYVRVGSYPGLSQGVTALMGYLKVWRGPGAFD